MFGLTFEQYALFLTVHVQHLSAMGLENQKKYCLSKIKNIEWDSNDNCIKVYYEDNWWHYTKDETWY